MANNLIPISKADLKGETVKQIFFINISGGDKTIIVFESGKVLVMPVYRECPVQIGMIKDLSEDFDMFLKSLQDEKNKVIEDVKRTTLLIKELQNGMDNKQSG